MAATIWAHDKIQTLRVKTRDGDSPALRLALMQTLASVNFHPAGMPPSAVFMIHYLEDPRPGELTDRKKNTSTWRSALRDNIDGLYRAAATPRGCALSGDPVAVLFRDQAELLACLVVDICAQRVGQHWWWRSRHFSSMYSSQRIRETLLHNARYVPAIFAQLASAGHALDVVKQLEPPHAGDILQVLLNEFSLENVRQIIAEVESEPNAVDARTDVVAEKKNQAQSHWPQTISRGCMPPWVALFVENSWRADLHREQAALLGIALTLQEHPAVMRNRIFQRSLAHWWVSENNPTVDTAYAGARQAMRHHRTDYLKNDSLGKIIVVEPDNSSRSSSKKSTQPQAAHKRNTSNRKLPVITKGLINTANRSLDIDKQHSQMHAENLALFSRVAGQFPQEKNITRKNTETLSDGECDPHNNTESPELTNTDSMETQGRHEHLDNSASAGSNAPQNHLLTDRIPAQDKITLPEEYLDNSHEVNLHFSDAYIDTRLGGIIFLINLVQQLGLPGCFAKQWRLEQQLGPWGLVDILARAILGKKFASLYPDPFWRVLAKLDGRRTKLQIANKFSGQTDYRIPQRWYEWLQDDQIYWASSGHKIRIWTAACVLVDARYTGDALASCITEMQAYAPEFNPACLQQATYRNAPLARRAHLQANGINTELARMLALVTPFIFAFLRQQLQLPAANRRDLIRELLYLDARIYISSSHIDLVTGIDNTRFTLRRAGLDQDPGWLPDYGRVVLIHFS